MSARRTPAQVAALAAARLKMLRRYPRGWSAGKDGPVFHSPRAVDALIRAGALRELRHGFRRYVAVADRKGGDA